MCSTMLDNGLKLKEKIMNCFDELTLFLFSQSNWFTNLSELSVVYYLLSGSVIAHA